MSNQISSSDIIARIEALESMDDWSENEKADAYNEWLLLYGYRWVNINTVRDDRPLFWSVLPAGTMHQYIRYNIRSYQLKTPDELTREQNAIINTGRTNKTTEKEGSANESA